ncbi:hypothetical protein [Thermotoga sp. KOL6]|uniref:TM0026 family membrane protein n=1 Tax=Thermotoga sp. KOL6 TaxID=126741 RepID=UPI000C787213|nr:hypothetical protein [Thermotoga sp. KOL6]PLV58648.1 hypothetical protein AS005_07105 [Thermotoga sp. KOL6]
MFTRAVITILSWALILEMMVLAYYIWRGIRPLEFYLNLGLIVFTVPCLFFIVLKERKRREKDNGKGE